MMMATKRFTGRELLQGYTGVLLVDMGSMYQLLSHCVGEDVYTHQIPRVWKEVKPWLGRWFPEIAEAGSEEMQNVLADTLQNLADGVDRKPVVDAWFCKVAELAGIHSSYEVPQIPQDDHDRVDPVAEAEAMGFSNVVVVERPEQL